MGKQIDIFYHIVYICMIDSPLFFRLLVNVSHFTLADNVSMVE